MIVCYKNSFADEEMDDVCARMLADDSIPVDTLLFFGRQFREPESERIITRFIEE